MGYGLREVERMKAIGRFVITEDGSPEQGHLPVTPVLDGEEWLCAGQAALKPELAICLLSSGRYCPPEMHVAMALLQIPVTHAVIALKGVRRDHARIEMIQQARALGAEFAVMFDDDNPPPSDSIVKMLGVFREHDSSLAVVAGIYVGKCSPAIPLVFKFTDENPGGIHWDWKVGDVFECDAIASGCMMIRLSVFDTLPEPWFLEVHSVAEAEAAQAFVAYSPRGYYVEVTDDMYLCHKLRGAGFRIMAHGGVLPGHWDEHGNCYRLAPDSYPMRKE
jgi:hypothetical protein